MCIYRTAIIMGSVRKPETDRKKKIDSLEAFTAKVLQHLAKDGILDSAKRPNRDLKVEK